MADEHKDSTACDNCVKLTGEKERLIYHLLRLRDWRGQPGHRDAATKCLSDMGYHPHLKRAKNMLTFGEPGKQ